MSVLRATLTAGALLLAPAALGVAAAAPAAAQACDVDGYSLQCVAPTVVERTVPTTPPAGQAPVRGAATRDVSSPATLPFTGGELVLVSTLGAAALAGGTALVVAGRRRSA